jgi:hypothetical protein
MGRARQRNYLLARGWEETEEGWRHARAADSTFPLARALHHQLTHDLCTALAQWQWRLDSYSARGYAQLVDGLTGERHSVPAALRVEAKRQGLKVRDFTYDLFLAAVVTGGA